MTQCEKVLDYMTKAGSITQFEAMQYFGCARLASRINDLRRMGHDIVSTRVSSKNRYGETVSYARYSINKAG